VGLIDKKMRVENLGDTVPLTVRQKRGNRARYIFEFPYIPKTQKENFYVTNTSIFIGILIRFFGTGSVPK
jgi:hypothetical protein